MKYPSVTSFLSYGLAFCHSTVEITRLCLRSKGDVREHVVELELPPCSPSRRYLIANLISYSPGTLVIGETTNGGLLVHAVTAADKEQAAVAEELTVFVEAWT